MKQPLSFLKGKLFLFTFFITYCVYFDAIAQKIFLKDIKVSSNFDSLNRVAKQQKGVQKLMTLLSIQNSTISWGHDTVSTDSLEKLIKNEFPQESGHLYFFKAINAFEGERNLSSSFDLATRALADYIRYKDTTGIIYANTIMGMASFSRDLKADHYPPYYMNAYNLSLKSSNAEAKILGLYARIRQYGDSVYLKSKAEEIIKIGKAAMKLIKENPYYEYLSQIILNALVSPYKAKADYEECYNLNVQIMEVYKKYNVETPAVILHNLGGISLALKRYKLAKGYFEQGMKYMYTHKVNDWNAWTRIFSNYHRSLVALKEYEKASIYADSISLYSEKYRISQNTETVNELSTKYQVKEKEQEAILLQKENDAISARNKLYSVIGLLALVGLAIAIYFSVRLRKKNQELETANNNIIQLNKLKEYFFSIIAHDLRQPLVSLNGVSGTIQYYLKEKNYTAVEKLIYALDESGQKLHNMLNNLLEWASVQRDEVPYEPQELNVRTCIEETLELYKHYLMSKDIKIEVMCSEEASLYADRNGFLLILRNLVGNALKFVSKRKGMIAITVEEGKNGLMRIKVSDNGSGIDAPKLGIIKEILAKPDRRQPGEKGSGLGLWLVSRFVKRNNGKIAVESKPEVGTTFTLAF